MVNFNRLVSFVAIVNAGSFTRAAQTLGITKAMVSADLKRLEAELGVSLVVRTTRRLALTEVGERFHRDCVRLIGEADLAVQQARAGQDALSGTLRVTSTAEYGLRYVVSAIAEFSRIHPALRIEYSTMDRVANRQDDANTAFQRVARGGYRGRRADPGTRRMRCCHPSRLACRRRPARAALDTARAGLFAAATRGLRGVS